MPLAGGGHHPVARPAVHETVVRIRPLHGGAHDIRAAGRQILPDLRRGPTFRQSQRFQRLAEAGQVVGQAVVERQLDLEGIAVGARAPDRPLAGDHLRFAPA
ncbi:MAG TPA: hypothetical protein VKA46_43465, partial [Gemmataceae bacterium]|nr:hypothetical protein [Gemmataceae bacterium]